MQRRCGAACPRPFPFLPDAACGIRASLRALAGYSGQDRHPRRRKQQRPARSPGISSDRGPSGCVSCRDAADPAGHGTGHVARPPPPAHAAASTPRQKQRGLPTAEAPFSTVEVRPAGFPPCLSPTCRPSASSRSKGRAAGRRRSTPGRPRPACAGA